MVFCLKSVSSVLLVCIFVGLLVGWGSFGAFGVLFVYLCFEL